MRACWRFASWPILGRSYAKSCTIITRRWLPKCVKRHCRDENSGCSGSMRRLELPDNPNVIARNAKTQFDNSVTLRLRRRPILVLPVLVSSDKGKSYPLPSFSSSEIDYEPLPPCGDPPCRLYAGRVARSDRHY